MSFNIFSASGRKILFFEDNIRFWLKGQPKEPICLEIQPSERCNHCCPKCQSQYSIGKTTTRRLARKGKFLDFKLLESIWERPPLGIVISGNSGDPLMHPNIGSLLERLISIGIPVALITNGTRLTDDIAQVAIRACRGIRISIDACDAISYRRTHGVGPEEWERAKASVVMLVETRQRLGYDMKDCLIGVGFLVGEQKRDMEAATVLASNIGADYIHFRPYHYHAESIGDVLSECKRHENESFAVWCSDQKYGIMDNFARSYGICHGAYMYNVIDARGDIYFCCHRIRVPEVKMGSLESISWPDWIKSQKRRDIIEMYSVSANNCVPLCRLHAVNEVLEARKRGDVLAPPDDLMSSRHAVFL